MNRSLAFFGRLLGPCLLAGSAWSCYEIPPVLPEGYIGSAPEAPGWPPPCAYDLEPLHPLNRWFHRAFSARDFSGDLMGLDAAEPLPAWRSLSSVDLLELAAITETLARGRPGSGGGSVRQAITDLVFRSDALQVAARLEAEDPAEGRGSVDFSRVLADLLLDVARGPGAPASPAWPPEIEPPPLRRGEWLEIGMEAGPGLRPEISDLRWTRILSFRGSVPGPSRIVFSRLRILLGPEGEPELLPLSSECWEAEVRPEDAASRESLPLLRLWRWDRARWAAGGDPWREREPVPGASLAERGPGLQEALAEVPRAIASGRCRQYAPLSPPEPVARAQLERAREALRDARGAADRRARG